MPPQRTLPSGRSAQRFTPLPSPQLRSPSQPRNRVARSPPTLPLYVPTSARSVPNGASSPMVPLPRRRRRSLPENLTLSALAMPLFTLAEPTNAFIQSQGDAILQQVRAHRPTLEALGSEIFERGRINSMPLRDFELLQRTLNAMDQMGIDLVEELHGASAVEARTLCNWVDAHTEEVTRRIQELRNITADGNIRFQGGDLTRVLEGPARFGFTEESSLSRRVVDWIGHMIGRVAELAEETMEDMVARTSFRTLETVCTWIRYNWIPIALVSAGAVASVYIIFKVVKYRQTRNACRNRALGGQGLRGVREVERPDRPDQNIGTLAANGRGPPEDANGGQARGAEGVHEVREDTNDPTVERSDPPNQDIESVATNGRGLPEDANGGQARGAEGVHEVREDTNDPTVERSDPPNQDIGSLAANGQGSSNFHQAWGVELPRPDFNPNDFSLNGGSTTSSGPNNGNTSDDEGIVMTEAEHNTALLTSLPTSHPTNTAFNTPPRRPNPPADPQTPRRVTRGRTPIPGTKNNKKRAFDSSPTPHDDEEAAPSTPAPAAKKRKMHAPPSRRSRRGRDDRVYVIVEQENNPEGVLYYLLRNEDGSGGADKWVSAEMLTVELGEDGKEARARYTLSAEEVALH